MLLLAPWSPGLLPACLSYLIVPWEGGVGKQAGRDIDGEQDMVLPGAREMGNMTISQEEYKHLHT